MPVGAAHNQHVSEAIDLWVDTKDKLATKDNLACKEDSEAH
jgi:hypothetical protein